MTVSAAAAAILETAESATDLTGAISVGEMVLDGCCDGNGWTLKLVIEGFTPTDGFPATWGAGERDAAVTCPPQLASQMHVIVARCVPTLDDSGRAPDPRAEQTAHLDLLDRASQAWNALARLAPRAIVGETSPFSIQGGCGYVDIPILVDTDEWC